MNGYYTLASNDNDISRAEYKSLKWRSITCVSANDLKRCFKEGLIYEAEIAEELHVDSNMVKCAYEYYKNNGML